MSRHVQVIVDAAAPPAALTVALERIRASSHVSNYRDVLREGVQPQADAVVLIADHDDAHSLAAVRSVLQGLAQAPRAALLLSAAGLQPRVLSAPDEVPLSLVSAVADAGELAARIETSCDAHRALRALRPARPAAESAAADQRLALERRCAGRVQRDLLPSLPSLAGLSFQVVYRPADYVSGDFYDVQQLDYEHVGIALVDATGHGVPAALMTIFVKRALHARELRRATYRLLPPDEVLYRLNAELLEADLDDCRFVAVTYALLNTRNGLLRIARGGAPFPLIRRANGSIETLVGEGCVVGVLPDAQFELIETRLARGDSLLLHSDGLDELFAREPRPQHATGAASHDACDDSAAFSALACLAQAGPADASDAAHPPRETGFTALLKLDVNRAMRSIEARHDEFVQAGMTTDDVTVLSVSRG